MAQKHSGLGIASFVLSIVLVLLLLVIFTMGARIQLSPDGLNEESIEAIMLGLSTIFFLLLSLIALGLGIGGLFQKERRKIFAILGTVFTAVMLVGTISLVMLGLATL